MMIQDGKGRGYQAEVTADNQVSVVTSALSRLAQISIDEGEAYAWNTVTADIDGTDTAILLCNSHTTKNLYIDTIYFWTDVATEIDFHFPAYSASFTGTAVTGVCLNRSSNNTAQAICYSDETANSQANLFMTVHTNETATDVFPMEFHFGGTIVLGYHDSIAIDIVDDSGAFNTTIIGYYK